MSSKFHDNGILVGPIDSFCLVCDRQVSEADANDHVAARSHVDNLSAAERVEKYKDDHILKVKRGYYCVFCNRVFRTSTNVSLHVTDPVHINNKGCRLLRREGAEVVFGELLLEGHAWQGFVDGCCTVCDVDVDDPTAHKTDPDHGFNLAMNKVQFGFKKDIYRDIDDTTFQCITCNVVLPSQLLDSHFEGSEHLNVLLKCEQDYRDLKRMKNELPNGVAIETNNNIKVTIDDSNNSFQSELVDNLSTNLFPLGRESSFGIASRALIGENHILESVTIFEKNEVNINFENEIAMCKKCSDILDFDCKVIEGHIYEHKTNTRRRDLGYVPFQCEVNMKVEHGNCTREQTESSAVDSTRAKSVNEKSDEAQNVNDATDGSQSVNDMSGGEGSVNDSDCEDFAEFAKCNHITIDKLNKNAYCNLCNTRIPCNERSLKEHVIGNIHITCSKMSKSEPPKSTKTRPKQTGKLRKVTLSVYLNSVVYVFNPLFMEAVVNDQVCMSMQSFHLTTEYASILRCQVCEVSLSRNELGHHHSLHAHLKALFNTLVITKYTSEFVREVRAGLFHCGFCNLLEAGEDDLAIHLDSQRHAQKKIFYELRLQHHLPSILLNIYQEEHIWI